MDIIRLGGAHAVLTGPVLCSYYHAPVLSLTPHTEWLISKNYGLFLSGQELLQERGRVGDVGAAGACMTLLTGLLDTATADISPSALHVQP